VNRIRDILTLRQQTWQGPLMFKKRLTVFVKHTTYDLCKTDNLRSL